MAAFLKSFMVGLVLLGSMVLGTAPASAGDLWWQQVLLLVHIPLGGGNFFTVNHLFSANQQAVTVNVKCFNETSQRVGPPAGINVELVAQGQVSNQTPSTLAVLSDPLFNTGNGWCYASSANDFSVQSTVGVTADLTPGGVLNSPGSSYIGTTHGLGEYTTNRSGLPFWTTVGGAQSFLILVNPRATARTVTVALFDANGIPQGTPLVRNLAARDFDALFIPSAFGIPTPPTSGSITITTTGGAQGYNGWYLQTYPSGRVIFAPINLDGDNSVQLVPADAP